MWTYNQTTGWLDKNGILVAKDCYSGAYPQGLNNPAAEHLPDIGPIPQGLWTISGPPFNDPEHGPYCLRLTPKKGTQTFGRSGFLFHGKPVTPEGINPLLPNPQIWTGSKGCICAEYVTRARVYQAGDTDLEVISGIFIPDVQV